MQPSNLLPWMSNSKEINDVDSGSDFKNAYNIYIKDPSKEIRIPIIFFTDKTHTDNHGRLCLQPLQLILGIFKREIRSNPKAWRTIGYITDTITTGKITTQQKLQDYHTVVSFILQSYKDCQIKPVKWIFRHEDTVKQYILKLPTLFIIGDTEE